MRRLKSLIACILAVIMAAGCTVKKPVETTIYEKLRVSEDFVKAQHDQFGKHICDATLESHFSPGTILVLVYPFANYAPYTPSDFSNIYCTKVSELNPTMINDEKPSRILELTIRDNSKQGVLDAIKLLEERIDIYSASPNYIMSIG